ncbi:hypothetical protein JCM19992_08850 [Thermostilla marina]
MSRYARFDPRTVHLRPIAERGHDLTADRCLPLEPHDAIESSDFAALVDAIRKANRLGRPVILFTGAHPIKLGLSRYLIDLVRAGCITHVATNGAGMIHDFELATIGGTSESVARWIRVGQFGLWQETGRLNAIVRSAAERDEGLGEAVGRTICDMRNDVPHFELSLAAACYESDVPMTVHVGIGCDIVHAHPDCDGAALGQASYTDFLIFAHSVSQLEGGVFLNLGTAVMGPEVYLKALSMARNVARRHGESIAKFTTAVFDLAPLPDDWRNGPPDKDHPQYYYRPWKTILVRTVADGGTSYYFRLDHRDSVRALWTRLVHKG